MCTVTFIPTKNSFYLTSNRDEHVNRGKAIKHQKYILQDGKQIVYPQDPDAGGSWIAIKNNGDAAVLLNGAFFKHKATPPYRKSRGLVLLDIIESTDTVAYFLQLSLTGIAPFTVIIFSANKLFEARWDGEEKHFRNLNKQKAYIWSSVTLYDLKATAKREAWFNAWHSSNPNPNQMDIVSFHRYTGDGNKETDLMVNRADEVTTVSITSLKLSIQHSSLQYLDLINHTSYKEFLPLINVTQVEGVVYAS